jgi:hypothetical protein
VVKTGAGRRRRGGGGGPGGVRWRAGLLGQDITVIYGTIEYTTK